MQAKNPSTKKSSREVVLVTGASSGLGQAIAKALVENNYQVFGTSRKAQTGKLTEGIYWIQMDLTNSSSIQQAVEEVIRTAGKIDALINNAGMGIAAPLEETPMEQLKTAFETNVFGVLRTCQAVIPQMRKQQGGKILNVSSLAGRMGLPFRGAYCGSKSALIQLSATLEMEVKKFGIDVVDLQPGDFRTPINENRSVVATDKNSPYDHDFNTTLKIINEEVNQGYKAEKMGKAVLQILRKKKPKPSYVIASPFQRFSLVLKYFLPQKTYRSLMMRHYKMSPSGEK